MLEYHKFKSAYDMFMKGLEDEGHELLTQLQRRYVALCDENTTLKMQIQEYEDILYLQRNLFFDKSYYWLVTGNIKQGPFCPNCYNKNGILMRLSGESFERHCSTCRIRFNEAPKVDTQEEYLREGNQNLTSSNIISFKKLVANR